MSPPTIAAYLVEFDGELHAGLRRRRRIVAEVEDHLREAAAAGLERALSPADAEAAAIACFGDPASVAEGFGADPVARVTTRLVVFGQSLDRWMAKHPWGGGAVAASVPAVLYLIGAIVGVLFNRMPAYLIPASALEPFPLTFLIWGDWPAPFAVGRSQGCGLAPPRPEKKCSLVPIHLVAESRRPFLVP